jgi:hypothetical protein
MTHFNLLSFLSCFTILLSICYSQTYHKQIAVLNLEAVGVSQGESITMTDRFRSELVNSGAFSIIERSELEEILTEQGFQQTGCTSDECAVEIGKLLNIRRICAGSIGKVGALYTVSVRMIDVETGEILLTVTEDCRCPVEEVLTGSMKKIADKLVEASKSIVTISGGGMGDIYLKSTPPDAQIYINNKLQQERTPATVRNLPTGECLIKVVKGDFVGSRVVTVMPNDIVDITIAMGIGKGGIKLYSTPAEAEILIGDQPFGATPKVIRDLPAGDYVVSLRKDGFLEAKRTVKVSTDEFSNLEVALVKPAALYVTSTPANAEVSVRGQSMGRTPLKLTQLFPERILVEVSINGYKTERKYVVLQEAQTVSENFILKELGRLTIVSQPPGAEVFINDLAKGITPITIDDLPDEMMKLDLKKEYYQDWQKEIILSSGVKQQINAVLTVKSGSLLLKSDPPGVSVVYNGKVVGVTPFQKTLPFGEYDFTLKGYQYADVEEKIILNEPKFEKTIAMQYAAGILKIANLTPGSTLYINDQKQQEEKNEYNLPVGVHQVKVVQSGYESRSGRVPIGKYRSYTFNGALKRKSNGKALLRSIIIPGWGQAYQEKRVQRWLYPVLFFGSLGLSYYTIQDYNAAIDEYDQSRTAYLSAYAAADINRYGNEMDQAYQDVESKEQQRNTMFAITGAIWLWNIVDIFLLPPGYQGRMQLSGFGRSIGLTTTFPLDF